MLQVRARLPLSVILGQGAKVGAGPGSAQCHHHRVIVTLEPAKNRSEWTDRYAVEADPGRVGSIFPKPCGIYDGQCYAQPEEVELPGPGNSLCKE